MKQSKKLLSILLSIFFILTLLPSIHITAANTASQGLEFSLNSNETSYIVTGIGNCADADIVIPTQYEGLPVTGIGSKAFDSCYILSSVRIPAGITSIGDYAFAHCTRLTGITIPASVNSIGDYAFSGCDCLNSVTIPEGITGIGEGTFCDCNFLSSITLPASITSIGSKAFYSCDALSGVNIPDSVTDIGREAFCDCVSLRSITIPENVSDIGDGAFSGCSGLSGIEVSENNQNYCSFDGILFSANADTLITFPAGNSMTQYAIPECVTAICDLAFFRCTKLTHITIPESVTDIGNSAFERCTALNGIAIPAGVTRINDSAFEWCTALTNITIPEGVTSIGHSAFEWCTALSSIRIPKSVSSIGNSAFDGCSKLTTITIPEGVTAISENAFYRCTALTRITLPESLTSIDAYAFYNCSSLTGITIPEKVASIGAHALIGCTSLANIEVSPDNPYFCSIDDVLYNNEITALLCYPAGSDRTGYDVPSGVTCIDYETFYYCSGLTEITIPEGVTSIGGSAFEGCSNLTSITIPDSVRSIGSYAFFDCNSLTGITIPEGVTCIDDSTFYNCTSLTDITLPESVSFIDNYAFYNCIALPDINIPKRVTGIGMYAFYRCSNLTDIPIPGRVTSIGKYAFNGCTLLSDVYYSGTQDRWNEIVMGSGNDQIRKTATIHYLGCDHSYEAQTVPATCTEAGSITYLCPFCGDSYTEELPALGHDLATDAAVEPTCTETGLTEGCHCVRVGCDYAVAQDIISAAGHSYANGFCTRCSTNDPERARQIAEPDEPQFAIAAVHGMAGDTVTVPVSVVNNPGLVQAYLKLYYDSTKLELIRAEDCGLLNNYLFSKSLRAMPYIMHWDDSLSSENNTANGELAVLTFRIREDCLPGDVVVSLQFSPYDVLDAKFDAVPFALTDGLVQVVDYLPGDLDCDQKVTTRDVFLLRCYLTDSLSCEIHELAADCDGVPGITYDDLDYLRRYLTYWEGYALKYPQ